MASQMSKRNHRSLINMQRVADFQIGGTQPMFLIAGPCVIEDVGICVEIASEASRVCTRHGMNYIFKASYDKANKTIKSSFRGPGWQQGLAALAQIKAKTNVPVLTDVHEVEQCAPVAEVADILQIPALLSKQIDLILAAASTGKPINIKKGQFTAPWEMNNVISRLKEAGFNNVMVTERGYMFGYQTLISDMRGLQIMSQYGRPVIFDGSHSVHGNDVFPNATQLKHRDFIRPLVRSAVANGIDGLFIETHPEPDKALSDAAGTLALADLDALLRDATRIDAVLGESA